MQTIFQRRRITNQGGKGWRAPNESRGTVWSRQDARLPDDSTAISESIAASSCPEKALEDQVTASSSALSQRISYQQSLYGTPCDTEVEPRVWRPRRRLLATSIIFLDAVVPGWSTSCDSTTVVHDAPLYGVRQLAEYLATSMLMFGICPGS